MSKHTPGPWYTWDNGSGMSVSSGNPDEALIPLASAVMNRIVHFKVPDNWTDAQWEEIKANARLVAAAPEMLSELKEIARYIEANVHRIGKGYLDPIKAVIAKAEGRS